jgi:hypothetical protein
MKQSKTNRKVFLTQMFENHLRDKESFNLDLIKNAATANGHSLSQAEVEEVIASVKGEKRIKVYNKSFQAFMNKLELIVEVPVNEAAQRATSIDSLERATEVVENPTEDRVKEFAGIMGKIVELRREASKLLAKGFAVSIAIKNPSSVSYPTPEETTVNN